MGTVPDGFETASKDLLWNCGCRNATRLQRRALRSVKPGKNAACLPRRSRQISRPPVPPTLAIRSVIAAAIDREEANALATANIHEYLPASVSEFVRRATLDISGSIHTGQRAIAFVNDKKSGKRQKLIDELLADPEYGTNFGTIWYHLLVTPSDDNRQMIRHSFADWLADQFNQNRGWNQTVVDILTAKGDLNSNPATVFWFGNAVIE